MRRALEGLNRSGAAERDADGVWQRCQELPQAATPPGLLDLVFERLHASTLRALQEQGTWRDHDIGLLNDYVLRSQDAQRFRDAREEDFTRPTASGRVYAHPAIDKERDARRDVQALREALVLTPDARKKHGRDVDTNNDDEDPFDVLDTGGAVAPLADLGRAG